MWDAQNEIWLTGPCTVYYSQHVHLPGSRGSSGGRRGGRLYFDYLMGTKDIL